MSRATAADPGPLASRLLAWFGTHGRHDLPWQRDIDPYRVWVSEIMLQQTQVATVIPYFERFLVRFPNVRKLASAAQDDVLALWSGLGYYARARNLHLAAQIVVERYGSELPTDLEALVELPGIGRSTGAAILALATGRRLAILDGNVKRVLARYHAVDGWPGEPAVERALWALAERHTPHEHVADYTQAIMDLGATLCTRARPACTVCPLVADCRAARAGTQAKFPAPRPKRARRRRRVAVLVVLDSAGRVLLERRPASGVWGGLHSLPELELVESSDRAASCEAALTSAATAWCVRQLGARPVASARELATIEHAFTHFDLDLTPWLLEIGDSPAVVKDRDDWHWYEAGKEPRVGIPAPVAALLSSLDDRIG
ncbi:MAG TPA: A/G-specific adenine glycosylase [Gammaproteobacteria bacterium]